MLDLLDQRRDVVHEAERADVEAGDDVARVRSVVARRAGAAAAAAALAAHPHADRPARVVFQFAQPRDERVDDEHEVPRRRVRALEET